MRLSESFEKSDIVRDGNFATLGHANSNKRGTLAYCDTVFYVEMANQNDNVTCIITNKESVDRVEPHKGLVLSPNPRTVFYRLHNHLVDNKLNMSALEYGIAENATIHPSAVISKRVRIGKNVTIAENVVIKDQVVIGDNTFIDAAAVIGSEGLLYITEAGNHFLVKHAGGVKIGKNVAILSNAVIARSIHESLFTTIEDYSLIGIASSIGHEVQIGKNCVVSGNCVIARQARVEDGAWIGSSVVIREYVRIGRQAQIKAGSIVIKDVEANRAMSGNFAMDHQRHLNQYLESQKRGR